MKSYWGYWTIDFRTSLVGSEWRLAGVDCHGNRTNLCHRRHQCSLTSTFYINTSTHFCSNLRIIKCAFVVLKSKNTLWQRQLKISKTSWGSVLKQIFGFLVFCYGFLCPTRNFSLILNCHHYHLRTVNFDL